MKKKPDISCFPMDNGIDTLHRRASRKTCTKYHQDGQTFIFCTDLPIEGYFRVHNIKNPSKEWEIYIDMWHPVPSHLENYFQKPLQATGVFIDNFIPGFHSYWANFPSGEFTAHYIFMRPPGYVRGQIEDFEPNYCYLLNEIEAYVYGKNKDSIFFKHVYPMNYTESYTGCSLPRDTVKLKGIRVF